MTRLSDLIRPTLPLPAGEVMGLALYHPELGYYRRSEGPWGFDGKDYYTALDLGPLLGEALALRLEAAWERLGHPETFTVLEPGAGRGWLGRDILAAAQGAFAQALRYCHRDDNPAARAAAREVLAPFDARVSFLGEADPVPPFTGAVLSNELFDALPAQPYRWTGADWEREVLTDAGSAWVGVEADEATAWFQATSDGLEPMDGSVWCAALPNVLEDVLRPLEKGLFLAIDYGDRSDRLLAKGSDLRRFKGHQVDGTWWEGLGEADLTADVDFTRLEALLGEGGCAERTLTTLGRWIRAHAPLARWEADWQALAPEQRMKRMENLLQLTLPGMMGDRFKVQEAWKPA